MGADLSARYSIAAVMVITVSALGVLTLGLGRWLGPRSWPAAENSPSEYGGRTGNKPWVQFRLRYAVVALLFIVFDMEMVYMFPWAAVFKRVGVIALLDMFVFIAILTAAILFAWKEGTIDWED